LSALRIAFAGTPDFSVPALKALLASGHTVVGVLTQPDRPKGRGRQLAASPVKVAALEHGLPVSQPETLKTEAGRAELAAWRPDVLVVVAYGLILPPTVLTLPRLGCVNIHASLLPRWRGAAPIQRAILAGDSMTGITIMLMDAGLDTGPMLIKKEVLITPVDTGGSLHDRLATVGAEAVIEALEGHAAGTLQPIPQPAEGVTYASKIEKSEALIDWNHDALAIERQVRAFNPWPVAETRLDGEQLRIFDATADEGVAGSSASTLRGPSVGAPTQGGETPLAGTIVAFCDNSLLIQCGYGQLALRQVQRPGRKPVSTAEFVRGAPSDLIGKRLG
jgi:methionyl-tRNA formyltransferase